MKVPRKYYLSRRQLLRGALALPLSVFGCRRSEPAKTEKTGPQVVDLYVQSDGDFLAFKPDELMCVTGTVIRLKFHHAGKFLSARHNWVLVQENQMEAVDKDAEKTEGAVSTEDPRVIAFVPMCDKGDTMMTQFVAPAPGDYPFFCSTPGHAEDMNGILHVTS